MKTYCFFDVRTVIDPDKLLAYRKGVLATVRAHGGRYLFVGGSTELLEGAWKPTVPVLIEFPTLELAKAWYSSAEYAPLKALRLAGSQGDAVIIESAPSELVEAAASG